MENDAPLKESVSNYAHYSWIPQTRHWVFRRRHSSPRALEGQTFNGFRNILVDLVSRRVIWESRVGFVDRKVPSGIKSLPAMETYR